MPIAGFTPRRIDRHGLSGFLWNLGVFNKAIWHGIYLQQATGIVDHMHMIED
jgi:hypothetical protein